MPRPPTRSRLFLGLAATALVSALLVPAMGRAAAPEGNGNPAARLKAVDQAIEQGRKETEASRHKAESLGAEVKTLRRELVTTAAATQDHEAEVARLEDKLAALDRQEAEKTARLAAGRHQFDQALMALQRLARDPPEALIVQPMDANDIVRSAILLRAAVPAIERRGKVLRHELADIADIRTAATQRRIELASATHQLKAERQRLDALIGRKAALKRQADNETLAAEKRVKALVHQAHDLQDLLTRIEAESRRQEAKRAARAAEAQARQERQQKQTQLASRTPATQAPPKPPAAESGALVPISKARGHLPFPVVGHIVRRYGQATSAGMTSKGLSIETRDGAQVVTPYNGLVLFAGPFRGYGQILILEHGEGYHTLLAGLGRVTAVPGQWLAAGEPVGVMGSPDRGNPVLYMELRRNGQPINPLPWLASQKDKVNG